MVSSLQDGWWWRLGAIPLETPVNQKTNQKSVPYKMLAPSSLPGPKPNHFINLCLRGWLAWKYA